MAALSFNFQAFALGAEFAFLRFLLRVFPYEPCQILALRDFLSPFPIKIVFMK